MTVKRRAPPRLRNRKIGREGGVCLPQETQRGRYRSCVNTATTPSPESILLATKELRDYRMARGGGLRPMQGDAYSVTPSFKFAQPPGIGVPQDYSVSLGGPDPHRSHITVEAVSGTRTPIGSSYESSYVPSPQQIIQAMSRSRMGTLSTPTTPRMSPSPWKNVSWRADEIAKPAANTLYTLPPMHEPKTDLFIESVYFAQLNGVSQTCQTVDARGDSLSSQSSPQVSAYVIQPDMALLQPLQVPCHGLKPLPAPKQWFYQSALCSRSPDSNRQLTIPHKKRPLLFPRPCRMRSCNSHPPKTLSVPLGSTSCDPVI
jgi:hypothetical protein